MKKLKKLKSKIIMFIFAFLMPLTATGVAINMQPVENANADSEAAVNYFTGYMKEVSLTNNNFSSSTSTYSISTSLSGWTGQVSDKKSTAGIINVGNTFQTYMSGTYKLSNNPGAKATDKHILMINSKSDNNTQYSQARQGYKSSSISLAANSFYSFQASFKSDTNYDSYDGYVEDDSLTEAKTISADTFKKVAFDEYISFTLSGKTKYLHKTLTEEGMFTENDKTLANNEILYEDDEYIGFLTTGDKLVFVEKLAENIIENDDAITTDNQYIVNTNTQLYTTNFTYDKDAKTYTAEIGTKYYASKKEYTALDDYAFGSIYLDGLTDKEGKPVKAEYVKVTSKEWVTFYFFVATGNESQSVSLNLWLGSKVIGQESTGVVFYDDVHVYQYSENSFWETYEKYFGRNYTQSFIDEQNNVKTETTECVNLLDLRTNDTINYSSHNFDFEAGEYQDDATPVKFWSKLGQGNARVFNTKAPQNFKNVTGYDFVGSTLTCDVALDENDKATITPHNYVLGLWANENYVEVKSNDISVKSNEILKIKAYYKVSELSSGKVYMSVEENNNLFTAYGIDEDDYTIAGKAVSAGDSENGSSEFNNKYGSIEFFVKGGAFYDSSVNLSLSLGKSDESATGCVVFDNISISKATSEEFESATNKLELNKISGTPSVSNGYFNNVTVDNTFTHPYSPNDWETTSEDNALTFAGVINTEDKQYKSYKSLYTENANNGVSERENPYLWASYFINPKNSSDSISTPDNVMMLANIDESYQQLKSPNIELAAGKVSKIKFKYKTTSEASVKISVYGSDGFKIYEADASTNNTWKDYEIYLNAISGKNEIYLTFDLGTSDEKINGAAYFDNFELVSDLDSALFEEKLEASEGNSDAFGAIDLSDFYLNLPTNNITTELETSTTPAYTGSVGAKNDGVEINGGIVKGEKFDNKSVFHIENGEDKNVFFITSSGVGSYSIDSNFNLDLTSGSQYVLSFTIKTNFAYTNPGINLDDNKTYSYGASVGLSGFEYATGLISNDEYTTYKIYFKASEDISSKLHIALTCDSSETAGSVAIYDLNFEQLSSETEYDEAQEIIDAKGYELNKDKVYIAQAENASDDETDEDEGTNTESASSTWDSLDWSVLISSLITGVAIIIAIVGFVMSRIKIKKIERKKKASYDRKSTLNVNVIKQKAKALRDEEIAKVEATADKFRKELENLEKEHKQIVVKTREADKGKVSANTDKEFKRFAQKRTAIAEKLGSLNKQIDNLKSPEYLLNLERKVYSQEEMRQKELLKVSKKLNKEKEKQEKLDKQNQNNKK